MKDSWIKPNGTVIEVDDSHDEFARDLLSKEMSRNDMREYMDNNHIYYPYEILHNRGWVRVKVRNNKNISILGNCVDLTAPQINTIDPPMNIAQLKTARRLCFESNTLFHESINDKRFW